MSSCPACGDDFRKGRKALVLLPTGELVPRIVCKDCASTVAVRIVPMNKERPPIVERPRAPEEQRYTLQTLKRKLRAFRAQAETLIPKDDGGAYVNGKVDGLDQAIALVDVLLEGRSL